MSEANLADFDKGAMARLVRVLERTDGPGLFVIIGLLDLERQKAGDQVRATFDGNVEERDLAQSSSTEDAVEAFFAPALQKGVIVSHFETWLTYEAGEDGARRLTETARRFLSKINFGRPRLAKIGRPTILLLPPFAAELLAELAPDFYDFRRMEAVLHDQGLANQLIRPYSETRYEPRPYRLFENAEERSVWIPELKERLVNAGGAGRPDDWIRLYKLLREDGAGLDSLEALDRALNILHDRLQTVHLGDPDSWRNVVNPFSVWSMERNQYFTELNGPSMPSLERLLALEEILISWNVALPKQRTLIGCLASLTGLIGDNYLQINSDVENAQLCYERSLRYAEQLTESFAGSAASYLSVIAILERIGELEFGYQNRPDLALVKFTKALSFCRKLIQLFGETIESLLALRTVIFKMGHISLKMEEFDLADSYFNELLSTSRRMVSEFGANPETLRSLALALESNADYDFEHRKDEQSARTRYEEAAQIYQKIFEDFGENPSSLKDLALALDRLGDLETLTRGDLVKAYKFYQSGFELRLRMKSIVGETPDVLEALYLSLTRLADFESEPCRRWLEAFKTILKRNSSFQASVHSREWQEFAEKSLKKYGCEVPEG